MAAFGYLDPRELRRLTRDPDWVAKALESLTWLGKGDMSPLHPSDDDTTYRLEDYLDQRLRRARRKVPPPAAFWDACVAHASLSHVNRLGSSPTSACCTTARSVSTAAPQMRAMLTHWPSGRRSCASATTSTA